jgi:hypothetical protein
MVIKMRQRGTVREAGLTLASSAKTIAASGDGNRHYKNC